jgi:hypothetical protein
MPPKKLQNDELQPVEKETRVTNNNVPEHLQKYANMGNVGFEKLRDEDSIIPRLSIAQSSSDQIKKGNPLFIEGLEVGQFFNTLSNEIYGDLVYVTPLSEFPHRIKFPPRGIPGIECSTRTLNSEGQFINGPLNPEGCDTCDFSKWAETPRSDGSKKPLCTFLYSYVLLLHTDDGLEPVVFSAKSKSIKPAQKWHGMIRVRLNKKKLPGFTMKFSLKSVAQKATKGDFFNFSPDNAGDVSPELIESSAKWFDILSKREIKYDTRGEESEDEVNNDLTKEDVPF